MDQGFRNLKSQIAGRIIPHSRINVALLQPDIMYYHNSKISKQSNSKEIFTVDTKARLSHAIA